MGCSRCGADVRLVPAHWIDRYYCPDCCLALEGRIPPALPATGTFSVARLIMTLDATAAPEDHHELDTDDHAWTRCDTCGQGSMVKRGTKPCCRITPHCRGRHVTQPASKEPSLP